MPNTVEERLRAFGITLPEAPAPAANYVPYVRTGNLLHVSGQVAVKDGDFVTGKVGQTMTAEEGAEAARLCALALLAQVKAACDGDLERLVRVVKLVGFVNSAPDFGHQPRVINGASDLMVEVLGEKGKHARSAVGAAALPFGVAVEVEGVFEVR
jgi:enamine deaminase RidA (YjgF/YER057c/UK114 family)